MAEKEGDYYKLMPATQDAIDAMKNETRLMGKLKNIEMVATSNQPNRSKVVRILKILRDK